jgi:hypothetical protein
MEIRKSSAGISVVLACLLLFSCAAPVKSRPTLFYEEGRAFVEINGCMYEYVEKGKRIIPAGQCIRKLEGYVR